MLETILSLYIKLIEIQKVKSPQSIKGLEVSMEQWKVLLNKVNNNKKLNKFERLCMERLESKKEHLEDYINKVS